MKHSYLTAGIGIPRLFRLLYRNKLNLTPRTIARVFFLTQSALWSSFFAIIEEIRYHQILKKYSLPEDPIFIVGHWRTGSTFLHQLLSLDPRLTAPTLFQVAIPDSFLVSYPYYQPIMKWMISKTRPMDNVRLGMDEPQEDEYAIYRITDCSPLERLVFPKSSKYFLQDDAHYLPPEQKIKTWEKKILHFYKKISFQTGKTIVSKNPFNSMRIPVLASLFPKSRFIHIIRHPYQVIPSTIHMWDIVQQQNGLNKKKHRPETDEVINVFDQLLCTIEKNLQPLSSDRHLCIRFEELESETIQTLEKIYRHFNMTFSDAFRENVIHFLNDGRGYKKNSFTVTDELKENIFKKMHHHFQRYGYS